MPPYVEHPFNAMSIGVDFGFLWILGRLWVNSCPAEVHGKRAQLHLKGAGLKTFEKNEQVSET